jgi:hypothetical protein
VAVEWHYIQHTVIPSDGLVRQARKQHTELIATKAVWDIAALKLKPKTAGYFRFYAVRCSTPLSTLNIFYRKNGSYHGTSLRGNGFSPLRSLVSARLDLLQHSGGTCRKWLSKKPTYIHTHADNVSVRRHKWPEPLSVCTPCRAIRGDRLDSVFCFRGGEDEKMEQMSR